jgi:uncharacterized protein YkwD
MRSVSAVARSDELIRAQVRLLTSAAMTTILGVGMAAVLAVVVPASAAPAAHSSGSAAAALVAETNEARRAAGCSPLDIDQQLRSVAQEHASEMARHRYLEHENRDGESSSERIDDAGYRNFHGENLAHGYPTAAKVMQVWMESAGHRENIENCTFTAIGVGYDPNGHYWVQDFGA